MNVFLFLYPVQLYFESFLEKHCWPDSIDYGLIEELDVIIDERYRQRGYKIYWLMFSVEHNLSEPDMKLLSPQIKVCEIDDVIVSGVSLERHFGYELYPDPSFAFTQLPCKKIDRLILGGFHRHDCVEKIAQYALSQGIVASVDDETTEKFFPIRRLRGVNSLIKET